MKRIRIAMVGAFVIAIGAAFVTKASVSSLQNAGFQVINGVCTPISTPCNTGGANLCDATQPVYQLKINGVCTTRLLHKN
jgi:hypothetical protein